MKQSKEFNDFSKVRYLTKVITCFLLSSLAAANVNATEANSQTMTNMAVMQQNSIIVNGNVVNAMGEPIMGASVVETGTTNGVTTNLDGNFSLKVKLGSTLTVSFVGFITQVVPAAKTVKVKLSEDSKLLEEIVVIGYGTQKKGDITSAITSVKAEDFTTGKIGDAAELIKGKVAGLTITNSSGDPNATSSIMLRGANTLVGSVTPLVLIDGIEGDLKTVAPENIASIDVLKDASAAAIYGTRGANGVIIITTKSGHRNESITVSYSDYFSFTNFVKKADFMTTEDVIYGKTQFAYEGYNTDWLKAITRKSGFKHNHSLSVNGGTKYTTYAGNVTFSRDWGVMRNSGNQDFKMQLDLNQYLWDDMLKIGLNVLVTRKKTNIIDSDYAYRQAVIRNPSSPVYNEDGSYNENFDKLQYYNPYEIQNEYFGNSINKFSQMVGNIIFTPIKGWNNKLVISWGEGTGSGETYTSKYHYSLAKEINLNGYASKSESTWINKNLEFTSNYNKTFCNHRINALVGYSYLKGDYSGFGASNGNFSTDKFLWNNLGNGTLLTEEKRHAGMNSYRSNNKLVGFFGRVSYGYAEKYNILASIRREGSSKFGDNNKWGTFPSFSAGWIISKEDFMQNTKDWLDNLKVRIGYGVTGVEPGDNYLSQYLYNFAGYGDIYSMDGNWIKTLEVTQNVNKDLKWETSKEWNFGLDFSVLEGRISGSIDYYNKTTKDLLYWYSVPVPPNMYGNTLVNVGDMSNHGIEIMINTIPVKTNNFTWKTTVTLSRNINKLKKLSNDLYETDNFQEMGGISDPISVSTHCMEVGHKLGDFWGLKSVGVDKDGYVLVEAKDSEGNWTVKQFNANLNTKSNRQRLGNGMPDVYMGWSNTLSYKGFDLNMQFIGQFGYKILNAQRCFYENNSIAYNRLKSADKLYGAINIDGTPYFDENGKQKTVKLSSSMGQGFWSDHLENGDFLKLSSAILGYNIPIKGTIRKYINQARIYVSTTNLFCITGYSGIDPEVSNYFMSPGIDDRDKYPTTRSYTFGMNITF